jgi:hypothetical protein
MSISKVTLLSTLAIKLFRELNSHTLCQSWLNKPQKMDNSIEDPNYFQVPAFSWKFESRSLGLRCRIVWLDTTVSEVHDSSLKMEAAWISEKLVSYRNAAWGHNLGDPPEDGSSMDL